MDRTARTLHFGSAYAKSSHVAKHNPTLEWHEVPQLLEDLESKSKGWVPSSSNRQ